MRISPELLGEIVAHAREEAPNECCGVIAVEAGGDQAVRVYRGLNKHASPLRFEIEERDQLRIHRDMDDRGLDVGAIYHSHTRSRPYPSQTDVNMAKLWPVLWVIVGLSADEPEVRAFRILDGQVEETELTVA